MEKQNGPWTIKTSQSVFKNEFLELINDEVIRPDGKDDEYAVVQIKPGACVLPIDDDGNVYLIKQFRYALGAESLEVAAGGSEDKDILENARRETKEEMGIEAEEWIDLGRVETDTSIVSCPAQLYAARKLKFSEPEREGTEEMKTVKIKFDEALEKVLNGEIKHALSCVLILKAKLKLFAE